MTDSGIKIEVHLIQNFVPSSLNRDDTGQPKSAYFGGFRRARISSQCMKRAVREWWREHDSVTLGERTKKLQQLIREELAGDKNFMAKVKSEEELTNRIRNFTNSFYAGAEKKNPENTNVLVFISREEVAVCVELLKELWGKLEKEIEGKKEVESISTKIKSAATRSDIALFGRMLAEHPDRNTDGACQVAHAISTHRVDMEMDFYTAVDDLNPEEETGAGMMGIIGFNSACFYRYAVVDRDQLARNLARKTERKVGRWTQELDTDDYQEADKVIKAFLEAMVFAIPTGRQNSFAARNLPSFGLFVRRQGGVPISLANAFVKPVWPKREGDDLVRMSVEAMAGHWDEIRAKYGDQGLKTASCFQLGLGEVPESIKQYEKESLQGAIAEVL